MSKHITVKELMALMGIGHNTAYALVHNPDFYPAFKIGRKILINTDRLQQWIDEQSMKE